MKKLAINGAPPVRTKPFPPYQTIGVEEKNAVLEVMESGILSDYLGTWSPQFYGGYRVQKFESEWADYFGCKHAVSVNSNTSGLNAAVAAVGVGPGDEVIVSPYTMSASAACVVANNAIPVFADIDEETFCINARTISSQITARTKAIVAVDIFGHPADFDRIMPLARKYDIAVIEDCAQAPGATLHGCSAGTLADMGVFSLNYHKTIHTGEGGMVTTASDRLANRVRLVRNHAETVVKGMGETDIVNMVGQNYRMTEIEAAIGSEQLKKLSGLIESRRHCANFFCKKLSGLPFLTLPVVRPGVEHGWYVFAMRYAHANSEIPRERVVAAIQAEGIPIGQGYVEPLYLQPMYQNRVAFGPEGFPFRWRGWDSGRIYEKGLCPVAERMHEKELIQLALCHASLTMCDIEDIARGIAKVFENLDELR